MKVNTHVDKKYEYTNWKVLAYTHQAEQINFKKDVAVGENLPQKAIVCFIPEKTYNGDWLTSKLAFRHHNAGNVLMKVNQKHFAIH